MDKNTVELSALGFQAVLTALLALVYYGLWQQQHRPYFATWAAAWAVYAARLVFISAYLVTREEGWLFGHQAATSITALLLLYAALQFERGARWRRRYILLVALVVVAWSYVAVHVLRNMMMAGLTSAIMISGVTLLTGLVFARHTRHAPSPGGTILAWTFGLWGLHHLDYPLLHPLGAGVLFGVFADVLLIVAAAVGTLFLVLSDGRRMLEQRNRQLEQLTHQLLSAQEDERRKIARELHDEAGQVLTAVKIELDLEGRTHASEMVGKALAQVRDLSNLLRPTVLDDLGLIPALRRLAEDFSRGTRIVAELEIVGSLPEFAPAVEVALYRVVQEALTNVARHANARAVRVTLSGLDGKVTLAVEDNGRGLDGEPVPHLGLLGIRERVTLLGGTVAIDSASERGFRLEASIPAAARA